MKHNDPYDFDVLIKTEKPYFLIDRAIVKGFQLDRAKEFLVWAYMKSFDYMMPSSKHVKEHFSLSHKEFDDCMDFLIDSGFIQLKDE